LPVWWLRGHITKTQYDNIPRAPSDKEAEECWQFMGSEVMQSTFGPIVLPWTAVAGTDGSGGKYTKDTGLGRCVFAFCVFNLARDGHMQCPEPDLPAKLTHLLLAVNGPLGGKKQTVPRAEPRALITFLKFTTGTIQVATDSDYVFKGFQAGPKHSHTNNIDMWHELWNIYHTRNGTIILRWVPSHVTEVSMAPSVLPKWSFLVNHVADGLCSAVAATFQVPFEFAAPIADIDTGAGYIRARLAAVYDLWFAIPDGDHISTFEVSEPEPKRAKLADIDEAASNHVINKIAPSRWACKHCYTSCNPLKPRELQNWLQGSCLKVPTPPWVHFSHHYACRDQLHVCLRCGSHSEGG
jgi:hypothetical protein